MVGIVDLVHFLYITDFVDRLAGIVTGICPISVDISDPEQLISGEAHLSVMAASILLIQ